MEPSTFPYENPHGERPVKIDENLATRDQELLSAIGRCLSVDAQRGRFKHESYL